MTIDIHLKFVKYVQLICQSASKQINALMRMSKHIDDHYKRAAYGSFIVSYYIIIVWLFHGQASSYNIKTLQFRALTFVFNSPYAECNDLLQTVKMKMICINNISFIYSKFLRDKIFNYNSWIMDPIMLQRAINQSHVGVF